MTGAEDLTRTISSFDAPQPVAPSVQPDRPSRDAPSPTAPVASEADLVRGRGYGPVVFRVAQPSTGRSGDLLVVRRARSTGSPVRYCLVGELCTYAAPQFEQFLERDALGRHVVLDARSVTFIDSTGIAVALRLGRRWRGRDRSLQFANPSDAVRRVVSILGLNERILGTPPADVAGASRPDATSIAGSSSERGRAVAVTVHNLERGEVVEVLVTGCVDADAAAALRRRLDTLASKRQPATLRLDLTAAEVVDPSTLDAVLDTARILDGFGSRLVVCNADPSFERAIPVDRLGRSLAIEHVGAV